MKKNNFMQFVVLLCILQITTISLVLSQGSNNKPLTFGVKVGLSNSKFTGYQQNDWTGQNRWGFTLGGFAEYRPMDLVGVEIGLAYVQEGSAKADPSLIYSYEGWHFSDNSWIDASDITLHTLQVPVLINIRPPVSGDVTPRVILGYSFDFILNATAKNEITIATPTESDNNLPLTSRNKDNVSSSFKALNMGPVFGLGLDFKSDKFTYMIDARYKIGIKDVNNLASLNYINGVRDFSINTFVVTFGIAF
jgi:hypothetical protein